MFDWNDLRFFLAVARRASLSGAARELGVSQSTVLRRVAALEQAVGQRLFDRLPGGYVLTAEGREVLCLAQRVEDDAFALDRAIAGRSGRLSGPLRVATSDVLAQTVLAPHLVRFCQDHPEVQVELLVGDDYVDLTRRDAEVAFRAGRPERSCLFGRKVTEFGWAVYAGRGAGLPPGGPDLMRRPFIGFAGRMAALPAATWLEERVAAGGIVYRTNSLLHMGHLVGLGLGLGVLPCLVGDADPALLRVRPPIPALAREGWLVTHEDLRANPRVQCFLREVGKAVSAERMRHAGLGGAGEPVSPPAPCPPAIVVESPAPGSWPGPSPDHGRASWP